jgi:hypothetical protein
VIVRTVAQGKKNRWIKNRFTKLKKTMDKSL